MDNDDHHLSKAAIDGANLLLRVQYAEKLKLLIQKEDAIKHDKEELPLKCFEAVIAQVVTELERKHREELVALRTAHSKYIQRLVQLLVPNVMIKSLDKVYHIVMGAKDISPQIKGEVRAVCKEPSVSLQQDILQSVLDRSGEDLGITLKSEQRRPSGIVVDVTKPG